MTACQCRRLDDRYPERVAVTNRFRKGAPRNFAISTAGHRLAFSRSDGADVAQLDLWLLDDLAGQPSERLLVRAADLLKDDEELSAAERARRERLRESGAGITGFGADELLTTVAFALSGQLWVVDIATGVASRVAEYEEVVDPRLNRRGDAVAFTAASDFVVFSLATETEVFRLRAEIAEVNYGLADFVASEELSRYRGHWWSPDGEQLLVQRTDESQVPVRWIADPTFPAEPARAHRYPAAGSANPKVGLHLVNLVEASATELAWDRDAFEYLASVAWSSDRPLVTVLSRDQRRSKSFTLHGQDLVEVLAESDPAWLDCGQGLPAYIGEDLLRIEVAGDRRRLWLGEREVDLGNWHLEQVVAADEQRLLVTAYRQPWQLQLLELTSGGIRELSDPDGYATATSGGEYAVVVQNRLDQPQPHYRVLRGSEVIHEIVTLAERPSVTVKPLVLSVTAAGLPAAVLFPSDHELGSHKLPTIVAIYGGPHHSEVIASNPAFADDQWLADQGYCVVVIDNRGTPGKGPAWERLVQGDLTTGVLADQVAGLQALALQFPDIDLDRVGIHGWSFGGYLSALAVLDRPDVYHAAWAGAPVTDWALYDTAYTERYLGLPDAEPEAYANGSLIRRAPALQRPLTLIHGMADDNVLAAHSLQLSGALLAAGRSHRFLPLAGVSHMTPQVQVTRNLMLLMRDFFDETLRAGLD